MTAKKGAAVRRRQTAFRTTLTRLMEKGRSRRRQRPSPLRKWPLLHKLVSRPISQDMISLAICAIDRVGPSSVRACASGVEVFVAVPDEAIAAVLRAALAETAQRRGTDRLVRIVVR